MKKVLLFLLPALGCAQPLPLSLERAVEIALAPSGNHRLALVRESIASAEARQRQARAAFLPQVEGAIAASSQTRNLAAFGFQFPATGLPGFSIPSFVGPFTVVDYRASATQSIFDFASFSRYRTAKLQRQVAESEVAAARESTAAQVARLYTLALRAEAALSTAEANVALAQRLEQLAQSQKAAGFGTGLDVNRAATELANARQRQIEAQNQVRRSKLELARALALDLSQEILLTSRASDGTEAAPDAPAALRTALDSRRDLLTTLRRRTALEGQQRSIRAERYPSLAAAADYGSIGDGTNQRATRSVGVQLRIPIFDGGRRSARVAEAGVQLRQEQIREADLRAQIELDVRLALDEWSSARERVATALQGRELAENELAQAERRLTAGIGDAIEVSTAQTRLERARENYLSALYQFNLARIELAASTGTVESSVKGLLP